jgi:hypothetical protein
MVERTGRLSLLVASVRWEGRDADAFRESWSSLEHRIQGRHDELQRQGQELQQHAEEQDRVSGADAAGPLPDVLSDLVHAVGGLVGDVLGHGSDGGLRLPLSAVASSELSGFQGAAPGTAADEAPAVPEDHAYASPQGDQTHSAGEDNGETTVTAEDAQGNKVTATLGDDGSVSLEAKDSLLKSEVLLPDGGTLTTEPRRRTPSRRTPTAP